MKGAKKNEMTSGRPLGDALRAAIVVTGVAAFMSLVMNLGSDGFYTTFGLFTLLVLSNFGGPLKSRFMAYLVTGAVGMALIVIGALAAVHFIAAAVVTFIITFVLGYSLVLRGYVTAAYVPLLLTYIVAVTTPQSVDTLGAALAAYAAGAIIAGLAAVFMWPSRPVSAITEAVRTMLVAAAGLIKDTGSNNPDTRHETLEERRAQLDEAYHALTRLYRGNLKRPGNASPRDRGLVQAVDDLDRLHGVLGTKEIVVDPTMPADAELMKATHQALSACAVAIGDGEPLADCVTDELLAARARHIDALPQQVDELVLSDRHDELTRIIDIGFAHRVVSFISMMILRHTRAFMGQSDPRPNIADQVASASGEVAFIETETSPAALLVSNFQIDSPWFRRAVQIAFAMTLSVVVIDQLHLQTGFWVILGVVASLQLTAIRSRKAALPVLIGTTAGFVVCAFLVMVIGHRVWLLVTLLPLVGFLTVWYPRGRYVVPFTQAGYTIWFVMLVSLGHHDLTLAITDTRIIDIVVGLAASLIVTSILWPRGVAARIRPTLDSSIRAAADFLTMGVTWITSALTETDRAVVDRAARNTAKARNRATEAFDLAISQGDATTEEADRWVTIVNAADYVSFAATMIRGLPDYGLAPIPDPHVAAELRRYAEGLAIRFTTKSDSDHEDRGTRSGLTDRSDALETAIAKTIDGWAGKCDKMDFEIPPCRFTLSRGHAAISMLWMRSWLAYLDQIAGNAHPAATPTTDDQ